MGQPDASYGAGRDPRDRLLAGVAVATLHVVIGYALVVGFAPDLIRQVSDPLTIFDLAPPEPPPPSAPAKRKAARDPRKTGAAAPANREAKPSEIVAPPVAPPPIPPPILAAPVAGIGAQAASGAAPVEGPGTGGGGQGEGTGSGGFGNGQGSRGQGTFAEQISGRIYDRDYPKAAARAGIGGTVWVRYTVTPKGRAQDCRVTRSSGTAEIDAVTCALIEKRFRYRPGTDAAGRKVSSVVEEDHHWEVTRDFGGEGDQPPER
ncbi:energy transducer TonB [Sphingomonas aliaeris]|uniref:energy transducer TonB n=1 Tax=Sphingomonas aliaeris TaxID=2759526 RepID=UPI001CEC2351|nr:energy transducer TonB [Sphingomonas aliaeris]